jgi:hypothetical protein
MMAKLDSHAEIVDLAAANRDVADTDPDVLLVEAVALRRLERLTTNRSRQWQARLQSHPNALCLTVSSGQY